ncbi:ParB/RepB/Spo0J family partition protein [Salipiger mangrovisoli]|uniref:ParB N-terminal domain-containing protein n=1 Tax=Salipiger mangrovisoli TaxID=2865933 RepID=A0ABR9X8L9_9RHOB|nr:ParB/RepB/Spo0J family partition protein [Salipiger mangrovisoli]MBE9639845.1 ParB N-terminal domain-containing protein [Salipiger mangrovisoli]
MIGSEEIRMVPLAHLHLSELNPRQSCTEAEIEALAMSLRTVGLLQNLGGLEEGPEKIGVVAGGRRLRALKLLAQDEEGAGEGRLIPIKITSDKAEARAWANTENAARMALNPADEIAAYGEMADRGALPETIAKAFAVSVRHVKGRLKLAGMAPVILDALRAGDITLDVAAAYTVAEDVEAQTTVFNRMQGSWNADDPSAIRRALKRDAEDASGLSAFVGRDAYEAEGGSITEDLFGEDVYFNDVALLNRLAEEKMQHLAAEMKAEGWKWVETSLEGLDYTRIYKLQTLTAERVSFTEDEAARYSELAALIEANTCTEEERGEYAVLGERNRARIWTPEQRSVSGVMLAMDYQGDLVSRFGLVSAADEAEAVAKGICSARSSGATGDAGKAKGPYSGALETDLAAIRTGAIQTAILRKPELALDLLTFALTHPMYGGVFPVGIRTDTARNLPDVGADAVSLSERLIAEHAGYMGQEDAADAFVAFREKAKKERNAMLTEAIARAFGAGLALDKANPIVEAIAEIAEARAREVWTPDRTFFARLTASQLMKIERDVLGEEALKDRPAKEAKRALVDRLDAIFNGLDAAPELTAEQKSRVEAWTPEGM